uniref:OTU domain-containing protein n=1 Tax=Panagrolaimus davidi TaxID=227884 RepID=A0A914QHC9_9BILA
MNAVDWNHPEIAQLIDDHIHKRPGYLSQNAIAQGASNILQRDIVRTSVQRRIISLKKKLKRSDVQPFSKSAPPRLTHHKPHDKMSDQSLLLDSMECMKILHDRKVQQEAQSTMKSFFSTSTPVIANQKHIGSIGFINSLNSESISPKHMKMNVHHPPEYYEDQLKSRQVNIWEGLNSKLNAILLVEDDDHVYEYAFKQKRNGITYYNCSHCRSHKSQTSTLKIYMDGTTVIGDHHPDCSPRTKADNDVVQELQRGNLAAESGSKAYDAYMKVYQNLVDQGLNLKLHPYWKYRRNLGRWRQKCYPSCEMGFIDEKYFKLYGKDNDWLDFNDGNVAIFATERVYRTMANCKILVADATFSTSPHGVYQSYYNHGFIENGKGGEWVPLLMALMKKKDEKFYQKIVDRIKETWEKLEVEPKTERIHLDYEAGEYNAMKTLVGEDKVYGCVLYEAYCMKKGKTNMPHFRSIRTWIRCLLALPLLPHVHALFLWDTVLHNIPQCPENATEKQKEDWPIKEVEELKCYMETNWIQRKDKMWEFFGLGRTKNTNVCETFHACLTRRYSSKPNLTEFLTKMQLEFTRFDDRIVQVIDLNFGLNPRNKKYQQLEQKLRQLEDEYIEAMNQPNLSQCEAVSTMYRFCRKASYLLHDVRNKSGSTKKSANKEKNQKLRKEAEESMIWKNDLNFALIDLTDIIDQTEISMIKNGEIDEDFEFNPEFIEELLDENGGLNDFDSVEDLGSVVTEFVRPYNPPSMLWLKQTCARLNIPFERNKFTKAKPVDDITRRVPTDFIRVKGDGHCGFRAFAALITGNERHHGRIRQLIMQELIANKNRNARSFF